MEGNLMGRPQKNYKDLHIKFEKDLYQKLESIANQQKKSKTEVLEKALLYYFMYLRINADKVEEIKKSLDSEE